MKNTKELLGARIREIRMMQLRGMLDERNHLFDQAMLYHERAACLHVKLLPFFLLLNFRYPFFLSMVQPPLLIENTDDYLDSLTILNVSIQRALFASLAFQSYPR